MNTTKALVRARAEAAEGSEKRRRVALQSTRGAALNVERARTADPVLEQLEHHAITDGEVVERRPFVDVAAMKEDFSTVHAPDEPVALADEQLRDAATGGRPAQSGWRAHVALPARLAPARAVDGLVTHQIDGLDIHIPLTIHDTSRVSVRREHDHVRDDVSRSYAELQRSESRATR